MAKTNGRDAGGRFTMGNPGGPGNPHQQRLAQWRLQLAAAVTDDDLRKIIETLVTAAKACEAWAVREILSRCLGAAPTAMEADLSLRLGVLESKAEAGSLDRLEAY